LIDQIEPSSPLPKLTLDDMKTNEEEVKDEQEEPENIELKKSISEIHIIEEEDFPTERP
jgi:hypothetical protein